MNKRIYLNTLTPEEIIKRLKAGEVIKRITDCGEVIYKMIDGIIVTKEGKYTTINECIFVSEDDDDHYFEEEETFEITETGVYRTRDGRKAFVCTIDEKIDDTHPVCYVLENEVDFFSATRQGKLLITKESSTDIVAKWEDRKC